MDWKEKKTTHLNFQDQNFQVPYVQFRKTTNNETQNLFVFSFHTSPLATQTFVSLCWYLHWKQQTSTLESQMSSPGAQTSFCGASPPRQNINRRWMAFRLHGQISRKFVFYILEINNDKFG